jgi:hypothetical protein
MRNIFLLYMPPGNAEAMVHYQDTIRNKVTFARIAQHISPSLGHKLQNLFGSRAIAVWGSRDTPANRAKFDRMNEGDEILIVEGQTIKLLGRVAAKDTNPNLSRELWQNLRGGSQEGWDLVYFIANPKEIELPFSQFCGLVGWQEGLQLRGFTSIARERLKGFYEKYDDLYEILIRLKLGNKIQEVPEPQARPEPPRREDEPTAPREPDTSDHLRMQWLLLKMGR